MQPPGGIGRSLSRLPFMSLGPAQKTSDTVAFVFFSHVISHLFSQSHWKELPRRSLNIRWRGSSVSAISAWTHQVHKHFFNMVCLEFEAGQRVITCVHVLNTKSISVLYLLHDGLITLWWSKLYNCRLKNKVLVLQKKYILVQPDYQALQFTVYAWLFFTGNNLCIVS